ADGTLLAHVLEVQAGGKLSGTGVIEAPTTIEGLLKPGNSPGTLTFTQPLALGPSSTLMLDIDGSGTGNGAGNFSRVLGVGPLGSFTAGGVIEPILRRINRQRQQRLHPRPRRRLHDHR